MNWNPQAGVPDISSSALESYMDFFESLTYDHVNFIFSGTSHLEDAYPSSDNMGYYKSVGYSEEPGVTPCYEDDHSYGIFNHVGGGIGDDRRRPVELFPAVLNEQRTTVLNQHLERSRSALPSNIIDCPRSRHNSSTDYQTPWLDNIDPDNMTYEELLELGEAVGTQSRGLSHEQIGMLPVSKFKCRFFLRRKSRSERCVICQMEYRGGDRIITLPCKHKYHIGCASKWLNINKACPICYTEVSITALGK